MNQDWSKPELASRKRRNSTQLSSLPSQHTQEQVNSGDPDDSSQEEEEEDDDDDSVNLEGGHPKKQKQSQSCLCGNHRKL